MWVRALCACVLYVPSCFCFVPAFIFNVLYLSSFFTYLTCLHHFSRVLCALIFLRVLRAFSFLRALRAFIVYVPYVPSNFYVYANKTDTN